MLKFLHRWKCISTYYVYILDTGRIKLANYLIVSNEDCDAFMHCYCYVGIVNCTVNRIM